MAGREIIRRATNKWRETWWARFRITGGRAVGGLFHGDVKVRDFNVKANGDTIAVDIGTGSGVKVNFDVKKRRAR